MFFLFLLFFPTAQMQSGLCAVAACLEQELVFSLSIHLLELCKCLPSIKLWESKASGDKSPCPRAAYWLIQSLGLRTVTVGRVFSTFAHSLTHLSWQVVSSSLWVPQEAAGYTLFPGFPWPCPLAPTYCVDKPLLPNSPAWPCETSQRAFE